jgi:hypothetical protein
MYCLHGPRVDATTDGQGLFHELSSREIDRLDAGSWKGAQWAGEPVPRLDSFLRWIRGKAKVFLDVKRADHTALIELIYQVKMEDSVFLWSGVRGWQQQLLILEPRLRQKHNISSLQSRSDNERAKRGGQVAGSEDDSSALAVLVEQLCSLKAEYQDSLYCVEVSLNDFSPELLDECHARGVLCMVMHCPPAKEDAQEGFEQIVRFGADLINLDHADLFLQVAARIRESEHESSRENVGELPRSRL